MEVCRWPLGINYFKFRRIGAYRVQDPSLGFNAVLSYVGEVLTCQEINGTCLSRLNKYLPSVASKYSLGVRFLGERGSKSIRILFLLI